jgi:hypothetical protein
MNALTMQRMKTVNELMGSKKRGYLTNQTVSVRFGYQIETHALVDDNSDYPGECHIV